MRQKRESRPKAEIQRLLDVMAALRAEDGCPWDREQTHRSLVEYLIEETHELVDAIENGGDDEMCEELGDVLLQVVFHAQIASEEGRFGMAQVVDGISDKLERRHPHVFADGVAEDSAAVDRIWVESRRREGRSIIGGIPRTLPPLNRAAKLTARAARVGFDWPAVSDVFDKLDEERQELEEVIDSGDRAAIEEELGDMLFVMANLARKLAVDPGAALRGANAKFERRFGSVLRRLEAAGQTPEEAGLEVMDRMWDEAKALEKSGGEVQ